MVTRPEAGAYSANLAAAVAMFEPRLRYRNGSTYTDITTGELRNTSCGCITVRLTPAARTAPGSSARRVTPTPPCWVLTWLMSAAQLGCLSAGVFVGAGRNTSNTVSDVTGYDARGRVTGYTTEAYATWYQRGSDRQGLWLDSVLQYGWFDNTVNGEGQASEDYKSRGRTASLEAGYVMPVRQTALTSVYVQPQGQVQWSGISADPRTEKNGTVVSSTGEDNVRTRLGMKVFADTSNTADKGTRNFRPYAEVNWVHNSSEYGVKLDDVKVDGSGSRTLAEVAAGIEGQLSRNLNVTGSVSRLQETDRKDKKRRGFPPLY
ncbi:autotransporter outer membrane beta-barrel domain-containing protein [Enterobacter mori]